MNQAIYERLRKVAFDKLAAICGKAMDSKQGECSTLLMIEAASALHHAACEELRNLAGQSKGCVEQSDLLNAIALIEKIGRASCRERV